MRTNPNTQRNEGSAGFSLTELMVAVVVIATVAAIGFNIVERVYDGTRLTKLEQDVRTLNSAATLYKASGGSLTGMVLPQDVLNKMKTTASASTAPVIVGMRGSFVDQRIRAVMMGESDSGKSRAVWNASRERFEIGTTGVGVKSFALDAPVSMVTEDRATSLAYSSEDKWVWDYTETAATRRGPSDPVAVGNLAPTPPTGIGAGAPVALPAPVFSVPSGMNPIELFPLELTLTLPAQYTGIGRVLYQIDEGPWIVYSHPVLVPGGISKKVQAYTASMDPDHYTDSPVAFEVYEAFYDRFAGMADGTFHNASGPTNMDVEFLQEAHRFEWGTEFTPGGFTDPNHVTFEGNSFEDVAPEEEFLLGTLTYFNGTTYLNSTANTVELKIELSLSVPEVTEELTFQLELESTPNHPWQTEDENADFVRLGNVQTNFSTQLNGLTYYLVLTFGEHTPNGFTTINQFHVHENATATGNVYGRLTATPPGQ